MWLVRAWQALVVSIGALAVVLGSLAVWAERGATHHPAVVYGVVATLLTVVPVTIAVVVVRRVGWDMLSWVALVAPVIAWIFAAIFLAVIKSLNGWEFV